MIFIPIGILIASIVSFVIGNKQWKSGTTVTVRDARGIPTGEKDITQKMSWSSIGTNIFGLIFLAIAIKITIIMYFEK